MIKDIIDKRYVRTICVCLNKIYGNKSALNKSLAQIITEYSHPIVIEPGQYLLCQNLHFFIVKKVLSTHWISGFFCPSELQFESGMFYYIPKYWHRSLVCKKKLFQPFGKRPHIRCRKDKFYLQHNKHHEPLSDFRSILQQLA